MKSQKTRKTMKRIAASLLVLCLILTTVGTGTFASYAYAQEVVPSAEESEGGNSSVGSEDAAPEEKPSEKDPPSNIGTYEPYYAAMVGYTGYTTLKAAVDAIMQSESKSGKIVIQKNIVEDVVIPADATIEIDLKGYKITNAGDHTIINRGTLVITDSSYGKNGTVDNVTDQKAALINEPGAAVTIEAGCITRSKETGIGFSIKGDNSYSTIINQGSLTIQDGASVTQGPGGGGYSHLICNGWRKESENNSELTASITIYGGTLSGGLTNIENYHLGEVHIYGGTFEDAEYNSICNYNIADIEGGTFSIRVGKNGSVVYNRQRNDNTAIGQLNIKGGTFTGNIQNVAGSTEVTGGTFTNVVLSELIPYGYTRKRTDDGNYIVTEGQSSGEASMSIGTSIGSSASDIISAGASKKETETVQLIVSDIMSNNLVNASEVSGLNSAFNVSKFLNSSVGSSLVNTSEKKLELNVKANLTKVGLKEKPDIQSEGEKISFVPASVTYEVYPTVKGLTSSGETKLISLQSNNSQFLNGNTMEFNLPIPSMVTEKYVKITHQSKGYPNEVSYSEILGNGTEKYTKVSGSHYSTFVLEFVDSIPTKEETTAKLSEQKLAARSALVTMKNGKKAVRITWYNQNGEMMDFGGVEIYRSIKRNSGYGKKPIFTSKTDKYTNTSVKVGTRYYYKVRGFVIIDGQKYYTDWSLKAIRTVK
ncbi:MAG: hypothetical protein MST07_08970 [Firmicutes bacterium]|nr:hypothetical protein [Bacillota bacterium]